MRYISEIIIQPVLYLSKNTLKKISDNPEIQKHILDQTKILSDGIDKLFNKLEHISRYLRKAKKEELKKFYGCNPFKGLTKKYLSLPREFVNDAYLSIPNVKKWLYIQLRTRNIMVNLMYKRNVSNQRLSNVNTLNLHRNKSVKVLNLKEYKYST